LRILDIFLAALKLLKNPSTDRVVVIGDTPWDAQGKEMYSLLSEISLIVVLF